MKTLFCFLFAAGALAAFFPSAQTTSDTTILQLDFNSGAAWLGAERGSVGTMDTAGSVEASGGLLGKNTLVSEPLTVQNSESNLAKLTLSFSLSVSASTPVAVRIESLDDKKRRTGSLETIVYPAAPNFHQRYAIDLSIMKGIERGKFQPTSPFIKLSLQAKGTPTELRLDNVHYAKPAYYVSPKGNDKNDGRTEKTAFADPQKAVNEAQPGDIILLMDGTYTRAATSSIHDGIVGFRRAGTPAAWISLKNYPGQHPILTSDGWNAVKVGRGNRTEPSKAPALAYIEVRGLHIRGNADTIKKTHPELIDQVNPITNGNGISGSGGDEANPPHHLRFADNLVEFCSGGGIVTGDCDWVTIENNTIRNNCWWMIYAGSGISLLGTANFDAASNVYKSLARNNVVSGNRCFIPWRQVKKVSDGNGIIIDSNHVPAQNKSYLGRTLVQNNLTFNNGGSGIHSFKSHQIDIINNTAYKNGASPELKWGQIFLQRTTDARVVNNILWARDGQPVNTVSLNLSDKENKDIVRSHNVYYGTAIAPVPGVNDILADPQFLRPSEDEKTADFRLKPGSPAKNAGLRQDFLPLLDLDGKPRRLAPTIGVFER